MSLDIEEIMRYFIGISSTKAVQYLGAQVLEGSQPDKDLQKSRLAINATKALVETLKPTLSEEESKQLNDMISNLHFAYVSESD